MCIARVPEMRRQTADGGRRTVAAAFLMLVALAGTSAAQNRRPPCAADNAGLTLPTGFCAIIAADSLGRARHMAVLPNGDLAVAVSGNNGGVVVLRDADGDGVMETRKKFGAKGGNGIAFYNNSLYFAYDNAVVRWRWTAGAMEPAGAPDTIVSGLAMGRQHAAKSIAIGNDGMLYVNIGAPSNACQQQDRTAGSPGMDPCGILDTAGGIWRFSASRTGQTQANGTRFATGLRNVVALGIDPQGGGVYGVSHGRDEIARYFPGHYANDTLANAEKPAEELFRLEEGRDYGWPYCFYDPETHQKLLNPEYGGDGKTVGRCANVQQPLLGFPAHYAPDGIAFYRGRQFPQTYRGGLFVAFHGSWNRAPMPQEGYNLVFVPMANGRPSGNWSVFGEGFRGDRNGQAQHRPVGVAVGTDGSLYVSDDTGGRVYRISYTGS